MERVKGIEPSSQAWEARILPLNHTRLRCASAEPFYQTARSLATGLDSGIQMARAARATFGRRSAVSLPENGLPGRQATTSSRLMASRNRFSISTCRSGRITLVPSSSRT